MKENFAKYDVKTIWASRYAEVNDAELTDFNAAMAQAKEIIDNPGNYATYQFKKAIEDLEAAFPAAQDYATGINEINNEQLKIKKDIYDLSGRKMNNGNLHRGIYIQGGRKVLR